MPNAHTFRIKPIKQLIQRYLSASPAGARWIDPFANDSIFKHRMYTNDLNPDMPTDEHKDALAFLCAIPSNSVDGIVFDPPYSVHQVITSYNGVGNPIKQITRYRLELIRVLKDNGVILFFGWDSNGIPATMKRTDEGTRTVVKRPTGFVCARVRDERGAWRQSP